MIAAVLGCSAIGGLVALERNADAGLRAAIGLAEVRTSLNYLQGQPWLGDPHGAVVIRRAQLQAQEDGISSRLDALNRRLAIERFDALRSAVRENFTAVDGIWAYAAAGQQPQSAAGRYADGAEQTLKRVVPLLDRATAEYRAEAEREQDDVLIGSVAGILLLLFAFGFYYTRAARASTYQRNALTANEEARQALDRQGRELREALDRLEEAQADRKRLLERTVEVAEHERIRIAGELHDGPIQRLTASALCLDLLIGRVRRGSFDTAEPLLDQVRETLAEEMASLRRLMTELRPPILDQSSVSAAVRDCAMQVLGTSETMWSIDGPDDLRLAPELETVLYRVAREALVNVRRHADASHVEIALDRAGDVVRLVVADNGDGIDETAPAGNRYGLIAMQERVESVGGNWRLESAPGAGTRIEAVVPWKPRPVAVAEEIGADRAVA